MTPPVAVSDDDAREQQAALDDAERQADTVARNWLRSHPKGRDWESPKDKAEQ